MNDDLTAQQELERSLKTQLRLENHESKCDMRYAEIFRRLNRLEKILLSFAGAALTGFAVVLYHLITKIPGY